MATLLTGEFTGKVIQSCLDMLCGLDAVQTWLGIDTEDADAATQARAKIHLSLIDPESGVFDESEIRDLRPYIVMSGQPFGQGMEGSGPVRKNAGTFVLCLTDTIATALINNPEEAFIAFHNATDAVLAAINNVADGSANPVDASREAFVPGTVQEVWPIRAPRALRPTQGDYHYRYVELTLP